MPFASKALAFLKGIQTYIIAGLIVSLAATNFGWHLTRVELHSEKQGRENDRLSYKSAQAEAAVLSYEVKIKEDEKNAVKAKQADEAYGNLLSKYNASLVRYKAAQRSASTIDLSSSTTTSDGTDWTRDDTRILITITDAQICAENTARLQAAHDWANSLKK